MRRFGVLVLMVGLVGSGCDKSDKAGDDDAGPPVDTSGNGDSTEGASDAEADSEGDTETFSDDADTETFSDGANAVADAIGFVSGRDGVGRGAAHTDFGDGAHGIIETPEDVLTSAFTVSAWIRLVDEGMLFGHFGVFVVIGSSSRLALYDMSVDNFPASSNLIGEGEPGVPDDANGGFHLVTLTVSSGAAALYINATKLFEGPISAVGGSCSVFFGHPDDSRPECFGNRPLAEDETGVAMAFDDIRIYSRALSANEISALYLN